MLTHMQAEDRSSTPYLRERYGLSRNHRKRWLLPAVLFLLVGGGWLIWSASHYAEPEVSTQILTFKTINSTSISIRYTALFRTSTKAHQCVLIASDYQAITVGQITDTIPAGSHSSLRTILIPTRAPASAASIDHCSLAP
jgi:hypothetical protein